MAGFLSRLAEAASSVMPGRPPAPIEGEVAVSDDVYSKQFPITPYTPDKLLQRKGFDILEQMSNDDQIAQSLAALKLMRLSGGWEIVPASESDFDKQVASEINANFAGMDDSVDDVLFELMGALEMGWSLQEILWRVEEDGSYKGRIMLKGLKHKRPKDFNLAVDAFDNLTAVVPLNGPIMGRLLPTDKFVVYSFQKRYENIFGTARTRPLYQWWWMKQVVVRALGVYMEKFGMPLPVGKYPKGMLEAAQAKFLDSLKRLRIEGAIILPDGTSVDFKETSGKGSEAFLRVIQHIDKQITKLLLGQTLTTDTGSSGEGSFALGKKHFSILQMYLDQLGRDLEEKPMAALIKRIVDYNYSGVRAYPKFRFKSLVGDDLEAKARLYLDAVAKGAIKPTPEDEIKLREIMGFPVKIEGETGPKAEDPNKGAASAPLKLEPAAPGLEFKRSQDAPAGMTAAGSLMPIARRQIAYADRLFTGVRRRTMTRYEEKVDFDEARATMDEAEARMVESSAIVLRDAADRLLADIKKAGILENGDAAAINKLQMRQKGELRNVFRDGLTRLAGVGMRDARGEVRAAAKMAKLAELPDISVMTPKEVLAFIESKSFEMAGALSDSVLKIVKNTLFQSVKSGSSYKDAVAAIEAALMPFLEDGTVDPADLGGSRLITVVRTNVSEAYNEARKSVFLEPDVRKNVSAFQYSAILDDRVRDTHAEMDGRVYTVEDGIWDAWTPPNGFNCRCILVPVTRYEEFEVSEPPPAWVKPDEGFA